MYICAECGSHFEQPGILRETHGEKFAICPHCKCDAVLPAEQCRFCGNYKAAYRLTEGYCVKCLAICRNEFHADLREKYDAERLYLLSVAMDGYSIDFPDPAATERDIGAVA